MRARSQILPYWQYEIKTFTIDQIIRAKEEKGDNWTIKQMVAFQKNLERRLKDLSAEGKEG